MAWLNILLCWPVEMNKINNRIIYGSSILFINENLIRLNTCIEITALEFLIFNNLYVTSKKKVLIILCSKFLLYHLLLYISIIIIVEFFCFKITLYLYRFQYTTKNKRVYTIHCKRLSRQEKYPDDNVEKCL